MKSLRLLAAALLACCAFAASTAYACDAHKSKGASATAATTASLSKTSSTATAASATTAEAASHKKAHAKGAADGCSAEMAAACTPAMKAACESNAAVASAMGCETKGTTAVVASSTKAKSASKMGDCCAMKGTKASTAAVTASNTKTMSADHCADAKGATATMAAGTKSAAHDCSACGDWLACEEDVRTMGARSQVVALKNGAMIVYTAESPADVKTLQSVISKRHQKMVGALAGTSGKTLCPECKALRGAIASGKLHREVVNVERGCMTLITSNDREVVSKIRTLTGQPVAMR